MAAIQEKVKYYKDQLDKKLEEKNPFTDTVALISQKTGLPKDKIVYGGITFLGLYLAIGYGAQFLSNFIGFLYPAYRSLKALETERKDDDTELLTYWVVYSTFALIEFFADILLFWIPLYWLLKCIFLVWLMAPGQSGGAIFIYSTIIRPLFLKNEKKIDSAVDKLTAAGKDAGQIASEAAGDIASSHLLKNE